MNTMIYKSHMYGLKPLSKVPECDIELTVVRGKLIWNLYNMGLSYEIEDSTYPQSNIHSIYYVYHKHEQGTTVATSNPCNVCSNKIDVLSYATTGFRCELCISCANWLIYDINTYTRHGYKIIYQAFRILYATKIIDDKCHYFTLSLRNYRVGMLELNERVHNSNCIICKFQSQFGYVDSRDRALCKLCARFPLEIISRTTFKCILLIGTLPNDLIIALYEYIIAIYDAIFRAQMFAGKIGIYNYI
jgi:hypothetical protein